MDEPIPFEHWPAVLGELGAMLPEPRPRVVFAREVVSTQDEAKRINARPGDIIVAWRQTSGRGRLGRSWADTGEDGVAMTFVISRDRPERLAISAAISLAGAIKDLIKLYGSRPRPRVGIKWPNDIIVRGKKVAGILIEQFDDRALVGIGVNVSQIAWPAELNERAVSLRQLGVTLDRSSVIHLLIQLMWGFNDPCADADLIKAFGKFDQMRGAVATFRSDSREVRGRVVRVDPMRGLAVQTEAAGEVWLPAATTTVLDWTP